MFTLLCGVLDANTILTYTGVAIAILEGIMVTIKFLQFLVPGDSKFGKFLARLFQGLSFLKGVADEHKQKDNTEKKD